LQWKGAAAAAVVWKINVIESHKPKKKAEEKI